MAASAAFSSSYIYSSQQVGVPECVADQINMLAPWETPLLNLVGLDSLPLPCTNTIFYWNDLEYTPTRTQLETAMTTSSTAVYFKDDIFKAGEYVEIEGEVVKLGSMVSGGFGFTGCTRSVGSAATAAHSDLTMAVGIGKPELQGTAAGTAIGMMMPVQRSNYTSIIMKDIQVSGTANVLPRYGRGANEYDYQAAIKLREAFETLENRVWWGVSAAPSAGTTAGGTKGLYEFIQGVNSATTSAVNPTFNDFAGWVQTINDFDNTASDLYLFCSLYLARVINDWGAGKIQHNVELSALPRMTVGQTVNALMLGDRRVIVVPYRKFSNQAFILNPSKIGVGPLQGRAMSHTYVGVDGDRTSGFVLGEYTLSVSNPRNHYYLYGLKAS
jgi:hypothetical protein